MEIKVKNAKEEASYADLDHATPVIRGRVEGESTLRRQGIHLIGGG